MASDEGIDDVLRALAEDDMAKGYVKLTWNPAPPMLYDAWYSARGGELLLTCDGRLILSTRSPGAFDAGVRLLREGGAMVVWHGFTLAHSCVTPV